MHSLSPLDHACFVRSIRKSKLKTYCLRCQAQTWVENLTHHQRYRWPPQWKSMGTESKIPPQNLQSVKSPNWGVCFREKKITMSTQFIISTMLFYFWVDQSSSMVPKSSLRIPSNWRQEIAMQRIMTSYASYLYIYIHDDRWNNNRFGLWLPCMSSHP